MRGLSVRPSWYPKYVPKAGDGCVLYCPGQDDPQSAVLRDISGNRNNGTITGATWVRNEKGLWALSHDGTDDLVTVPYSASLSTANITALLWLYPTQAESWTEVLKMYSTPPDLGYRLLWNDADPRQLYLTAYNAGSTGAWTNGVACPLNAWHFAAFTIGSSAITLSVDLSAATINTQLDGAFGPSTSADTIAMAGGGQYTGGKLGLLIIFSRVLTSAEIQGYYNQTRHLFGV